MHTIRGVCIRVCAGTPVQGFACLLQPNSELQSDNRELWVISHHASSGTAGVQEPCHISSHSDLGRKLPSLNSDVRERERGSQKRRASGRQWDRWRQRGWRTDTLYKKESKERLAQSGFHKWQNLGCGNDRGKSSHYLQTQISDSQVFTSFLVSFFLCLFLLPLISELLWLYWIEQWLCIDLVSTLRTNMISALCLCRLTGRW